MGEQQRIRDALDCSYSGILSSIMLGKTKSSLGLKGPITACLGRELAADSCSCPPGAEGCPHELGAHYICFMQCSPTLAGDTEGSTARLCLR